MSRPERDEGPGGLSFSEGERRALRYCVYCPRMCRFACPVAHGEARESVTPWGLMRLLHLVDRGHVAADGPVLEVLNHCVSCGRCQSYCRHDNPVAEVLARGRAQLVTSGLGVPPDFAVPEGGCEGRVPLPEPAVESIGVASETVPVYMPSCAHLAGAAQADALVQGLEALAALGLPVVTPSGSSGFSGCGFHEWEVGRPEAAAGSFERFEAPSRGRPGSFTDCGPSLFAAQETRPELTGALDHLAEWLLAELPRLPEGTGRDRVALHDACFEVRRLGLGQVVRTVVRHLTGSEPRDLHEAGGEARCCGAVGRWAASFPEALARSSGTVADDIADAEVDLVVTPSPHCRAALEQSLRSRALVGPSGRPVAVVDLLGLVARAADGEA